MSKIKEARENEEVVDTGTVNREINWTDRRWANLLSDFEDPNGENRRAENHSFSFAVRNPNNYIPDPQGGILLPDSASGSAPRIFLPKQKGNSTFVDMARTQVIAVRVKKKGSGGGSMGVGRGPR